MKPTTIILTALFGLVALTGCPTDDADTAPCLCTAEYAPVCGKDGVTYGNPCEAACEGITEYTEGECEEDTEG